MRVLHINSGQLYGGIEVLLVTLARQRHFCPEMEPEFAVCYPGRTVEELRKTGTCVHEMGAARWSRPWTVWRVRSRLREILHKRRPDVVVCHGAWTHAIFAPVVRRVGLPLVLWLHTPPAERLHWLERLASWTPPDWTIANSDFTLAGLHRLFPKGQGTRIYCPVECNAVNLDLEERSRIRASFGAGEQHVVLLQVGRWEPGKGHLVLLDALARIARLDQWICWQVGAPGNAAETAYWGEVQKKTRALGLENRVRFLGFQDNLIDLPQLHACADVYCQPNNLPESFGIAVVEALYAGLPVVTSNQGGPSEIIDGTCGILVKPNQPGELAERLGSLIQSQALRRQLAESGPARARRISDPANCMGQLYELLAQDVLHQSAVASRLA